jgi:hypothetical protein
VLGELRCRDGEVEQEVDAKAVSALKKYALAGASRRSRMAATIRLAIVEITFPMSFRREIVPDRVFELAVATFRAH